MSMTVEQLAQAVGAKVRGDGTRVIEGCAGLEQAQPQHCSFLANRKYASFIETTQAGAIITSTRDAKTIDNRHTLLIADDPYFAFRQVMVQLHGWRRHPAPGVSEQASIDPTATIGENCTISPFVYIGPGARIGKGCVIYPHCFIGDNATLGEYCQLFPNVTVYDHCVLGNRVTLHAGCIIGQDGFGYAMHQGVHEKIPATGNVIVEDDVEMGALCAVDRATVGSTIIGRGSKFSDQVAIGHGARVGRHNLLVAQVGLAGSVTTGDYVVMGGQVGVAGHLNIADRVQIAAKAGVMDDLDKPGGQYGGVPAMQLSQAKRNYLLSLRMPDMLLEFKKLQDRVAELEASLREKSNL